MVGKGLIAQGSSQEVVAIHAGDDVGLATLYTLRVCITPV